MIHRHKIRLFSSCFFTKLVCLFLAIPTLFFAFEVSQIHLQYESGSLQPISIGKLENIPIPVRLSKSGLAMNREFTIQELNASGKSISLTSYELQQVTNAIANYFHKNSMDFVYISIDSGQITKDGRDLRDNQELKISILVPKIAQITSYKTRDGKKPLSSRYRNTIQKNLPIKANKPINRKALNNYLYALNRQRGKRVDVELSATNVPGEVVLDILVAKDKPWIIYGSATNNTPNPVPKWQESIGFIHTQLSNNDDILHIDATTDSFDSFYSFYAAYEAYFLSNIYTRWRLTGNYNRFLSADFALTPNLFKGRQIVGIGDFIWTFFQHQKLFLDWIPKLEYRHIRVQQHLIYPSVAKNFLFPALGFNLSLLDQYLKLIYSAEIMTTVSDWFWNVPKNLSSLGRTNLSINWALIKSRLYFSFYLENLFQSLSNQPWKHINEVVIKGEMQNSFNQRLIPQLEGVLGGLYSVRGYPMATTSGDNLYFGSFEYRFHIAHLFSSKTGSGAYRDPNWDVMLKAFYDLGRTVINQKSNPLEIDFNLFGFGFGLELVLWKNLFARLEWARSLKAANGIPKSNNEIYVLTTVAY